MLLAEVGQRLLLRHIGRPDNHRADVPLGACALQHAVAVAVEEPADQCRAAVDVSARARGGRGEVDEHRFPGVLLGARGRCPGVLLAGSQARALDLATAATVAHLGLLLPSPSAAVGACAAVEACTTEQPLQDGCELPQLLVSALGSVVRIRTAIVAHEGAHPPRIAR